MDYIAISKNVRMSPRKVRLVAESMKKKNIASALNVLSLLEKRASGPVRKTLNSAIANAVNNFNAKKESLSIKEIAIGGGPALKRYHYAGRGRMRPYKRRTSNIRVVLTDNQTKEEKPKIKDTDEKAKIITEKSLVKERKEKVK